jgi:DHA3 family tetracycline resistance protein-like MFS transporter
MDSYRFYLHARACYAVCWTTMVTLSMVFMVTVAGLDPLQMVLAVVMALFMREQHFRATTTGERETWVAMQKVFLEGVKEVRGRPILLSMLLITAMFGVFSEGIDRLFTPYLLENYDFPSLGQLEPVTWWGIIAAVSSLFGLATTTIARRKIDLRNQLRLTHVLSGCLVGVSAAVLLLANVEGFYLVLACYWLMGALRSAYDPLMTAWLNRLLPEASRATLFSMYGQADAAGQSFGGPMVGMPARTVTIGFALGASALALLPTLPLFNRMARDQERKT